MMDHKTIHEGHRYRMKQKFREQGLDSLMEHEILELLLYYAIPRKNTNVIAHRLIDEFGSLSQVFDTPPEILKGFGLSESTTSFLKLIPQVCSYYYQQKTASVNKRYVTDEEIGKRLLTFFLGATEERVVAMYLNSSSNEIISGIVSKGSVGASEIYIRKLIEYAIQYHASGLVIAHNHPSGVLIPSEADIRATVQIQKALAAIHVKLYDHFIFSESGYISMANDEPTAEMFML